MPSSLTISSLFQRFFDPTTGAGLLYALVLGLGSVLGMEGITLLLAFPFAASHLHPGVYAGLRGIAGVLSLFIGGGILVTLLFY